MDRNDVDRFEQAVSRLARIEYSPLVHAVGRLNRAIDEPSRLVTALNRFAETIERSNDVVTSVDNLVRRVFALKDQLFHQLDERLDRFAKITSALTGVPEDQLK